MAQTQVQVPWGKNCDLGVGVDLATGSPMDKVVDGIIKGVTNAEGATTFSQIARITSSAELEGALGISAEALGLALG
jgi:hypothetical protein